MKIFDRRSLAIQLAIFSGVFLFSIFCLPGVMLFKSALLGDRLGFYSYFYDILHSLNRFGEIPWWNPIARDGFPQYYTSIVGLGYLNPLFVLLALPVWLLGRFGVYIIDFTRMYVLYFGILEHLLFLVSVFLFSRQLFKNTLTLAFILVIAAFYPGAVTSLTDIGFSSTAYGLLFSTAFLAYIRTPSRRQFLFLLLASAALSLTFNYNFLFWNVLFIPLLVGYAWLTKPPAPARFPARRIVLLVAVFITCFLPTIISYTQGSGISRSPEIGRFQEYYRLGAGNPLSVLTASVPAVSTLESVLVGLKETGAGGAPVIPQYMYLGLITLPLAFIGVLFSRHRWRLFFAAISALCTLVFILSGYSPLFSLVLFLRSPLSAMSHFANLSISYGYLLMLLFTAATGFDLLVRHPNARSITTTFTAAWGANIVFAAACILTLYPAPLSLYFIGFSISIAAAYGLWLVFLHRSRNVSPRLFWVLIALLLVDVSTISFIHVRENIWTGIYKNGSIGLRDPAPDSVGIGGDDPRTWYSRVFLILDRMKPFVQMGITPPDTDAGILDPRITIHSISGDGASPTVSLYSLRESGLSPLSVFTANIDQVPGDEVLFINDTTTGGPVYVYLAGDPPVLLTTFNSPGILKFGDIDGDGREDMVYLSCDGELQCSRSVNGKFPQTVTIKRLHPFFDRLIDTADINGDGLNDLILYSRKNGELSALYSTGLSFTSPDVLCTISLDELVKRDNIPQYFQIAFFDVNNDGRDDLLFHSLSGTLTVRYSTQDRLEQPIVIGRYPSPSTSRILPAHLNRDTAVDVLLINDSGEIFTSLNRGSYFSRMKRSMDLPDAGRHVVVGRLGGRLTDDIITLHPFSGEIRPVMVNRTYNRMTLSVDSPRNATLVVRNAWSPYWYCTVNGKPVSIGKAFINYMSIDIPTGSSKVEFVFEPLFMAASLVTAYGVFGMVLLLAIIMVFIRRREPCAK